MRLAIVAALFALAVAAPGGTQEYTLAQVLQRAAQYAAGFETSFSVLVAEEQYVQEVRREGAPTGGSLSRNNPGGGLTARRGTEQRRRLRADYLLVRLSGGGGWMPFRDVFEVDGRAVQHRDDRLAKLFLTPSESSFAHAAALMSESSRYNLGGIDRTINIPTLAVMFPHPDLQARFAFRSIGDETIAGMRTWVVEYREQTRPTLIKTTPRGAPSGVAPTEDLPLRGKLWIDPATGVIVRTELTASDAAVHARIEVDFQRDAELDLWIPREMRESYRTTADDRVILGTAKYQNYRRFQVKTDSAIGKPPPG